jgi:hypothetical protein
VRDVVEDEQECDHQEGEKEYPMRLNQVVEDIRGRRSISRSDEGEESNAMTRLIRAYHHDDEEGNREG